MPPNEVQDIIEKAEASVPDDILLSTALAAQEWHKAQAADSDFNYVVGAHLEGNSQSPELAKAIRWILDTSQTGKDICSGMVSYTSLKSSFGKRSID